MSSCASALGAPPPEARLRRDQPPNQSEGPEGAHEPTLMVPFLQGPEETLRARPDPRGAPKIASPRPSGFPSVIKSQLY